MDPLGQQNRKMPQADAAASKAVIVTTVHQCVPAAELCRVRPSTARTAPGTDHVQQQVVLL
jgi:hypothetical protein